jgi:hypothetical protein
MSQSNCWEFKNCGRQPGGEHESDLGICPAATESRLDGVHGGKNAGRTCWVVAGTLCGGKVVGSFAEKIDTCYACDFYVQVRDQTGLEFQNSILLFNRLKP